MNVSRGIRHCVRIPTIFQTSKGNENWFEKSGVRNIGDKITVKQILKGNDVWFELSEFLRIRGFEKSEFSCRSSTVWPQILHETWTRLSSWTGKIISLAQKCRKLHWTNYLLDAVTQLNYATRIVFSLWDCLFFRKVNPGLSPIKRSILSKSAKYWSNYTWSS